MRNKKSLLLSGLLMLGTSLPAGLYAQSHTEPCATDRIYAEHVKQNPALRTMAQQMETQVMAESARFKTDAEDTTTYVIPVVFHIIHNNGPENIAKYQVDQQLITLNEAYSKRNADTTAVRAAFRPLVANAHIRFELAKQDPWGRPTTGIDRVVSTMTDNASDNVKPLSWWDNSRYLNIWVVRSIQQPSGLQGVLAGYAQFPWENVDRSGTDGIVIGYQFVGKGQKTLPHEVGHYLGLFHTFQDGCSDDQKLQGDHVSDTPPVDVASYGWNPSANTCHADVPDMPDMIENFMDYADRKYMFTPNQVTRMRSFARGARANLIAENNPAKANVSGIAQQQPGISVLSVYPNPVHGMLSIRMLSQKAENCHIEISDITGKTILAADRTTAAGGENLFTLDLSTTATAKGVYMLRMSTASAVMQQKIMIE